MKSVHFLVHPDAVGLNVQIYVCLALIDRPITADGPWQDCH